MTVVSEGRLDRDAAREAIFDAHPVDWDPDDRWFDALLDALEGCVRLVPQATIDRGRFRGMTQIEAMAFVMREHDWTDDDTQEQLARDILALVVPDPRFDAIRQLHVEVYGDCRVCHQVFPCSTLRILDGEK